jgi:signal transduction histidine kinase
MGDPVARTDGAITGRGAATRATAATTGVPCLVLLSERYGDKVFPLRQAVTTIGRSLERDVMIDDPQVSKRHAEVVQQEGRFFLRDTGSRNGTRVNGLPATEVALKGGDRVELGDAVTLFFTDKQIACDTTRREAPPAAPRPAPLARASRGPAPLNGVHAGGAPSNGTHGDAAPPCRTSAAGANSGTMAMPAPLDLGGRAAARAGAPTDPAPLFLASSTLDRITPAAERAGARAQRISLPREEVAAAASDRRPARVAGRLDEGGLTLIYQIAEALGAARGEKELLERALDLVAALIPADHAHVFLPEEASAPGAAPRVRIAASRAKEGRPSGVEAPASTTIVEQVLAERTAIATTDAANDERWKGAESVVRNRIRAVAAAPLVAQGAALGVLYLDHDAPGYLFNKAELHLLTAIAFHLAHALETARAVHALEERVEERTREVERLSRERAELLSMAAHDLKTPLAGLLGYLECLGERVGAEGAPVWIGEELTVCAEGARAMMALLNDLLDGQRAEAGRIAVHREPVDLAPFLNEVASVYERWAIGAGRRVELHIRGPLPSASIDRRRVTQILNNLVHNGLKYTPRGAAVRIEAQDLGGGRVEIAVVDEGKGFNPSESDRIFLSFERGTASEPARGEGHGLGLAIVKKLTALLGGVLAVEGRPGKGARFRVALPIA